MRVLLDTHVLLGLLDDRLVRKHTRLADLLIDPRTTGFVSVASLWEMAIKTRLGKLKLGIALADVAGFADAVGLAVLAVESAHAVADIEPEPETRDPIDRLLLAQCHVENLRLITLDRALIRHPLALPTKL